MKRVAYILCLVACLWHKEDKEGVCVCVCGGGGDQYRLFLAISSASSIELMENNWCFFYWIIVIKFQASP